MLSRQEYNELYKLLENYTRAWESYVRDVKDEAPSVYGAGALVTQCKEDLITKLKELS